MFKEALKKPITKELADKVKNTKEEDILKMDYKERQAFFKIKSKIVGFRPSRDKYGKGLTYKKVQNDK